MNPSQFSSPGKCLPTHDELVVLESDDILDAAETLVNLQSFDSQQQVHHSVNLRADDDEGTDDKDLYGGCGILEATTGSTTLSTDPSYAFVQQQQQVQAMGPPTSVPSLKRGDTSKVRKTNEEIMRPPAPPAPSSRRGRGRRGGGGGGGSVSTNTRGGRGGRGGRGRSKAETTMTSSSSSSVDESADSKCEGNAEVTAAKNPSSTIQIGSNVYDESFFDHILNRRKLELLQDPEIISIIKSQRNKS